MARRLTNVEQRHEIKTGAQIVDIRPVSEKFVEWLGLYPNLVALALPVAIATAALPIIAIITVPFLLFCTLANVSMRTVLPVRYPKGYKDEKGKPGVREVERVSTEQMQAFKAGEGVINSMGKTHFMKWFYMGGDIEKHRVKTYHINRFLQVAPPSKDAIIANSIAIDQFNDPHRKGREMMAILRQQAIVSMDVPFSSVLADLSVFAQGISSHAPAEQRAIELYMRARDLISGSSGSTVAAASNTAGGRSSGGAQAHKQAPRVHGQDTFDGVNTPHELAEFGGEAGVVEEALDDDPLSFLKSTPFERKPASEVLGGIQDDVEAAKSPVSATSDAALFADPVQAMLLVGKTVNLSDEALIKGRALALLVGAPDGVKDPATGATLQANDDWIGAAILEATSMVSSPRSSDDTVIGFNKETMGRVVDVEVLMSSPSPAKAAKAFERVVAAKVTPPTVPEDSTVDASPDEMDAFFAQISGQQPLR